MLLSKRLDELEKKAQIVTTHSHVFVDNESFEAYKAKGGCNCKATIVILMDDGFRWMINQK